MPDVAFDHALRHGRCVGVWLPATEEELGDLASVLPAEERAYASALSRVRRRTWVGGRVAARRALRAAGIEACPCILPDERGAPHFPSGIAGSISHKDNLAVALVAPASLEGGDGLGRDARIGVDVELDRATGVDIAAHVLADDEMAEIGSLEGEPRAREVLLRFSAKEAVYKALDPFVRRYVAFHEVSVTPSESGAATVRTRLRSGEGPFSVEVRWRREAGVVLTTARIRRAAAPAFGESRDHW